MCGIFGFITKDGNGPDLARLRRIAAETQTRGNHAFGLAWLDAKGILHLPGSLHEALAEMESSELLATTLGDHVFEWFLRNKRAEWASYKAHVTQFELDRYLPLL